MENLKMSSAAPSSHKTARDVRFLLAPPAPAANDLPYGSQGVLRRVVLHAGTELGVSLFARRTAPARRQSHHHPAVGRSRIVKYNSGGTVYDERRRPRQRLRLACHQQGLDHPGSLQRRMELLRVHCQGLGLRPDYYGNNEDDIDFHTHDDHYPPCSGTTLMLGLSPPASSPCSDMEVDA